MSDDLIIWDDPPAPPPTEEQLKRLAEWWKTVEERYDVRTTHYGPRLSITSIRPKESE
jgi:hypothetical protein